MTHNLRASTLKIPALITLHRYRNYTKERFIRLKMINQLLPVNAYKDTKRRLSEIVTNVCNNYSPRTEDNLPSIKNDIEYLCQEVFHGQVFDKISVDVRSLQKKSQWGPKARGEVNDDSNIISVIVMVLKTSRNPNNPCL